jgi:hypothetical protein
MVTVYVIEKQLRKASAYYTATSIIAAMAQPRKRKC